MTSSETPYRFESADGYSVISFQPELNDSQWADFEKVGGDLLERLSAMKKPAFIVDLSALSYMGSAMVALIVRLWKSVKERNGNMVVVNKHEMVFEVLKLAGLHEVWTIVESREMALKHLGKRSTAGGGQESGTGLLALGGIGVLGGLVGLALMFTGVELGHEKAAMLITMGCSALGLIAGAMSSSVQSGGRKNFAIAILIASVVILLGGILLKPEAKAATPKPTAGGGSKGGKSKSAAGQKRIKDDDDNSKEKKSPAKDEKQNQAGKTTGNDVNNKNADKAGADKKKGGEKKDSKADKKKGLNVKLKFRSDSDN